MAGMVRMATGTLPALCAASAASAIRRVPSFCVCAHRSADPPSGSPRRKCSSVRIQAQSYSDIGLQWRLVIQDFFGARHVARLSNWQICWHVGDSGQCGFAQMFIDVIQRFQCFSTTTKRGRFEYLKRSLSIAHFMANGDTCPQRTSNARHVATLAGLHGSRESPTASTGD
jgi:hypothetical protein